MKAFFVIMVVAVVLAALVYLKFRKSTKVASKPSTQDVIRAQAGNDVRYNLERRQNYTNARPAPKSVSKPHKYSGTSEGYTYAEIPDSGFVDYTDYSTSAEPSTSYYEAPSSNSDSYGSTSSSDSGGGSYSSGSDSSSGSSSSD